jgi:integrase
VSDFLRLEKTHLKNDLIEIKTQKTKTIVVIPIHEQIKKILLKRNGNFPRKISSQKLNDYVKELCQIIGFDEMIVSEKRVNKKDDKTFFTDQKFIPKNKTRNEKGIFPKYELISSHICRRSFATNLYGKIPNMTIMAVTGHKTETQFLKYIKVTPRENAEKLNEYWQQQENKG